MKKILPLALITLLFASLPAIATNLSSTFATATENNAEESLKENEKILEKQENQKDSTTKKATFSKWKLGINGGYSHLLAKISDQVPASSRDYVKDLKSGYHFSLDASYFWKEEAGMGIKYSNFKSSNSGNTVITNNGSVVYSGTVSDNITTQYIGPVLNNRYFSKNRKTALATGFGLGYINYYNKGRLADDFEIKGGALGVNFDLNAEFSIGKKVSIGLGLGYLAGSLKKIERRDGNVARTISLEKGEYESMSRLDVFAGLKFNL